MNVSEDRERVLETLRRARQPETQVTPESLERNLRWLVRLATPKAVAPVTLRQRVQTLVAFTSGRLHLGCRRIGVERRRGFRGSQPGSVRRNRRSRDGISGQLPTKPAAQDNELLELLLTVEVSQLHQEEVWEVASPFVRHCLVGLPELQREALQLQLVHELSVSEIAAVIGQSEREILGLLRAARQVLFGPWWPRLEEI